MLDRSSFWTKKKNRLYTKSRNFFSISHPSNPLKQFTVQRIIVITLNRYHIISIQGFTLLYKVKHILYSVLHPDTDILTGWIIIYISN